jgi:hypothetical protein
VEVTSIKLAKLASLTVTVSWIEQMLRSDLSTSRVLELLAKERELGSWSGHLSLCGSWPADKLFELVTRSDTETSGLEHCGGIYLCETFSTWLCLNVGVQIPKEISPYSCFTETACTKQSGYGFLQTLIGQKT